MIYRVFNGGTGIIIVLEHKLAGSGGYKYFGSYLTKDGELNREYVQKTQAGLNNCKGKVDGNVMWRKIRKWTKRRGLKSVVSLLRYLVVTLSSKIYSRTETLSGWFENSDGKAKGDRIRKVPTVGWYRLSRKISGKKGLQLWRYKEIRWWLCLKKIGELQVEGMIVRGWLRRISRDLHAIELTERDYFNL